MLYIQREQYYWSQYLKVAMTNFDGGLGDRDDPWHEDFNLWDAPSVNERVAVIVAAYFSHYEQGPSRSIPALFASQFVRGRYPSNSTLLIHGFNIENLKREVEYYRRVKSK